MEVWFHGKPKVGCLHPECFAHSLDFRGHSTLVFKSEKMLDDGVTERNIEAAVVEPGEVRRIPGEGLYVFVPLLLRNQIHAEYLHVSTSSPAPIRPECVLTAHVENS